MKLSIQSAVLSIALTGVCRIAARKASDMTGHLLIEISSGRFQISAFNGKQQLTVSLLPQSYGLDGIGDQYCVQAAKLGQIVASLPRNAEVTLERNETMLSITSGKSRFNLVTLPSEKFPHAESFHTDFPFQTSMSAGLLSSGLRQVGFCASRNDVRTALNGVCFDFESSQLSLAATDGYRMGVVDLALEPGFTQEFILPSTSIEDVAAFCNEGDVEISFNSKVARFSKPLGVLYTKLVDGAFPDYKALLAKFSKGDVAKVSRADIASAVSRVILMDEAGAVRFSVERTSISVQSIGAGDDAIDSMPCDYDADPFEIGFKGSAAAEVLRALDSDDIELIFNGGASATLLRDQNCSSHSFVIMPYRL